MYIIYIIYIIYILYILYIYYAYKINMEYGCVWNRVYIYTYISPNNNSNREYCDSALDFGVLHVQTNPYVHHSSSYDSTWATM